jgi:hypothetical protein
MNMPVKSAVSKTPAIDRITPGTTTGFISENRVSIPPEKRMMFSAIIPTY